MCSRDDIGVIVAMLRDAGMGDLADEVIRRESGGQRMDEPIEFLASFPNVQSAIRVAGDGGARITLDIPDSEMPAIVRLMLMRGIVLRVTVEPEFKEIQSDDRESAGSETNTRTKGSAPTMARRRVQRPTDT